MGLVWFFISRTLVKHKFSEVICYSLIAASISITVFMILITGIKNIKGESGLMGGLRKVIKLAKFFIVKSLPATIILGQLAALIVIMVKHADYLFTAESLPKMFLGTNCSAIFRIPLM